MAFQMVERERERTQALPWRPKFIPNGILEVVRILICCRKKGGVAIFWYVRRVYHVTEAVQAVVEPAVIGSIVVDGAPI